MARCHRIGQSKHVTVYRLITRRSFEAEMFERASKKLGLEQAVLGTRNFNEVDLEEAEAGKVECSANVVYVCLQGVVVIVLSLCVYIVVVLYMCL